MDNSSSDIIVNIALFGVPVVIALGLSIYVLFVKQVSKPSLFVFTWTIGVTMPCSIILGFVHDFLFGNQKSAGVLLIFMEPPVAVVIAGIAAGTTLVNQSSPECFVRLKASQKPSNAPLDLLIFRLIMV